jgi:deoxynucleoside triphosphate triphosphohydrolase SAMHD1
MTRQADWSTLASAMTPQAPQVPQRATIMATSSRQIHHQSDDAETRTRMKESLKKSVTLVFWYKVCNTRTWSMPQLGLTWSQAGQQPVRLHQEIATFPMFCLSHLTQLVSDLGLQPNSYIDVYNPQSQIWEQETITRVREVQSEQRLLFRLRKTLLDGLQDQDCPSLDIELRLLYEPQTLPAQIMSPLQKSLKRSLPDTVSDANLPATKQFRPSNHQSPFAAPQVIPTAPQMYHSPSIQLRSPIPSQLHQSLSPNIHPASPLARQDVLVTQPAEPPPNNGVESAILQQSSKRWPNDYYVCEISNGFDRMDEFIADTPSLTQKTAFERVFRCRYVKSTVCRHRGVWRRADQNLKESFKQMGLIDRALWGEFVKKTDFRRDGTKPKHQEEDQEDHDQVPVVDFRHPINMLGLVNDQRSHPVVCMSSLSADPPMASLRPSPG